MVCRTFTGVAELNFQEAPFLRVYIQMDIYGLSTLCKVLRLCALDGGHLVVALTVVRQIKFYIPGWMYPHAEVVEGPQTYTGDFLSLSQVCHEGSVLRVPTAPFTVGMAVASPQPVGKQTGVDIFSGHRFGCCYIEMYRQGKHLAFLFGSVEGSRLQVAIAGDGERRCVEGRTTIGCISVGSITNLQIRSDTA